VSSTAEREEYEESRAGFYDVRIVGRYCLSLFFITVVLLCASLVVGCGTLQEGGGGPDYPKRDGKDVTVGADTVRPGPFDVSDTDVNSGPAGAVEANAVDAGQPQSPAAEAETVEAKGADVNVGPTDVNTTETSVRDVNAAEANAPDMNAAEANAPDVNVAEANAPEANKTEVTTRVTFHEVCADILGKYVDDEGMVKYKMLDHRKQELDAVLGKFAKVKQAQYDSWPKSDRIAFWINAYNIQMLRILVDNYPIESSPFYRIFWPPTSVRHIEPTGVLGVKKWDRYKFIVMDEAFTLSEIERRLFREDFGEPRVFFAVTHATLSGPLLRNEPYCGYKLDEQLDVQVKKFLARPRSFRIDRDERVVYLSVMFDPDEYGKEFIDKYGTDKKFKDHPDSVRAVLNFISGYVSPQDRSFLETQAYKVKYIGYDWRLNDGS